MKIISIKKDGKNIYSLQLEEGTVLKIYDNVILNNQLLFKKEITSELLEKIKEENKKEQIYYETLKFITKKMRSKQEVIDFLIKKEVSDLEKERIIKKLETDKFINDELYVRAYIQDHINLTSDGPKKIKDYLLSNNISEQLIIQYLQEIGREEIYQKLEKIILKKIKLNNNKSAYLLKQKICFEMASLGYEKEMIEEILEKNIRENSSSVVMKEYQKLHRKLSSKLEGEELRKQVYYKLRQKGFSEEEIVNIEY